MRTLQDTLQHIVRKIGRLERDIGRLKAMEIPGNRFVPLSAGLTSTAFDGDTLTSANNGIIDLSSSFGAPAGVKAVLVSMTSVPGAVTDYILMGPDSSNKYGAELWAQVASRRVGINALVTCDANGDIYMEISGTWTSTYMRIWGYFI